MQKEIFYTNELLPPTIFISPIDGKHYIVPCWIEVPLGTTREQIVNTKPVFKTFEPVAQVKALKGKTIYTISKLGNRYKCSCSKQTGCNHIKQYLTENK